MGWRGKWEVQKVKIMGWGENSSLETAIRWKNDSKGSNINVRGHRKGEWFTHGDPLTTPSCSLHHTTLIQKRALPLSQKRVRGYRITSRSCPCPLLATAKINPVLAGTRLMRNGNHCTGRYNSRSPLFAYKCPKQSHVTPSCKWGKSRLALKSLRRKTFIL